MTGGGRGVFGWTAVSTQFGLCIYVYEDINKFKSRYVYLNV
jgi:hypothetical protein